jgi:hypothetical protein
VRFSARSRGGQLGLGGFDRHEARVRSASAADPDLVACGGALEVVAEVVADSWQPTSTAEEVELRGLTSTWCVVARPSSYLASADS